MWLQVPCADERDPHRYRQERYYESECGMSVSVIVVSRSHVASGTSCGSSMCLRDRLSDRVVLGSLGEDEEMCVVVPRGGARCCRWLESPRRCVGRASSWRKRRVRSESLDPEVVHRLRSGGSVVGQRWSKR